MEGELRLVDITEENWLAVCLLSPGREGQNFVAGNALSIAQSVYEKGWVIKAIEKDGQPVGFAMYGFSKELAAYELCRFMIGERYQGMGYGKRALQLILDEMFRRYGCREIYLSTSPSNTRGKHLYQNAGFTPTGRTCGAGGGLEEIFRLTQNGR